MKQIQSKNAKRLFLRAFLIFELLIFGYAYAFGAHGIKSMIKLKNDNSSLKCCINELKDEVSGIENQINQWESDSFYKEKIAREQLQMARKNEEVYFIV